MKLTKFLRVQSDGTDAGTKVFCPDGTQVMVKSVTLQIVARELEQVTMVFYLTRKLCAKFDGSPEGGLFFENGDRMDGLVRLTVDPLEQNGGDTATAVFYPWGSKGAGAQESKLIWRKETDFASAPTEIYSAWNGPSAVIDEVRRILNAGPNEGTTAAAARVVADWKACMEELDADGCAKWQNERNAIIEALDKLGAPTKAESTPPGISVGNLSIVGRIRALADRSIHVHNIVTMPDALTEFMGRPIEFWHDVQAVLRTLTTRPGDELEMLKQTVRQNMARGTMLAEMTRELKRAGKDREEYTNRILAMLRDMAVAAGYDPDEATHGEEMVAGTIKAIKALRDCTENAWAIIANAGGGEWAKEGEEWQAGAIAWRETFTKLQSAYVALNPQEREVPGAEAEVSKECGHGNVWVFHQMPDTGESVIQHGTCMGCGRVVNRWAAADRDYLPGGQWCIGQGESLELPRTGFIEPKLIAQGK